MDNLAPYVVRISPRAQTLTFKHPLVSQVIRKSADTRDPTKGWVGVTATEADILRPIRVGGSSDPHAPPLFEVMKQEDAIVFQQAEIARLGLGTAENPVGGSPMQAAKLAKLEAELASFKLQSATNNERVLALLTQIASKQDPALAAQLREASGESLHLDLAPGTSMPDTAIDPPPQNENTAPAAQTRPAAPPAAQGAPGGAQGQQQKARPGAPAAAQGQTAKQKKGDGGGPAESLSARMRAEGTISGKPEGDLAEDKGTAGAESA